MLEASRSLSCARFDVLGVCLSGEDPFSRCVGTAERGNGCSGGEIWDGFCAAMFVQVRILFCVGRQT